MKRDEKGFKKLEEIIRQRRSLRFKKESAKAHLKKTKEKR